MNPEEKHQRIQRKKKEQEETVKKIVLKKVVYTIKVEFDPEDAGHIAQVMDEANSYGTAHIEDVEVVKR